MKPITEYKDYRKFMQDFYDEHAGPRARQHFNKVTKMYYELLKRRKEIDYKEKIDNINKDF